MITPKKNAKSYGVVHFQKNLSFIGFSKNVNNKDFQKIDIIVNNEIIDTITCDEYIKQIDDIYDIEQNSFSYKLPNQYAKIGNQIEFKFHNSKNSLENSPITIGSTYPQTKFFADLKSTKYNLDDLEYSPVIGFLGIEENIENSQFIDFIRELLIELDNIKVVVFCFNNEQKNLIYQTFKNEFASIEIYSNLLDINEIISKVNIWIDNTKDDKSYKERNILFSSLLYECDNILCIKHDDNIFNITIGELDNLNKKHPFIEKPLQFKFKTKEKTLSKLIGNELSITFKNNQPVKDFIKEQINFSFNNKDFRELTTKRANLLKNYPKD